MQRPNPKESIRCLLAAPPTTERVALSPVLELCGRSLSTCQVAIEKGKYSTPWHAGWSVGDMYVSLCHRDGSAKLHPGLVDPRGDGMSEARLETDVHFCFVRMRYQLPLVPW